MTARLTVRAIALHYWLERRLWLASLPSAMSRITSSLRVSSRSWTMHYQLGHLWPSCRQLRPTAWRSSEGLSTS